MTDVQRLIWDRVIPEPNSGCWLWHRFVDRDGYGHHTGDNKGLGTHIAHRLSYMAFRGPIPAGFQVDHLCRVRCCVNPDHLDAVPKKINDHRSMSFAGINARKPTAITAIRSPETTSRSALMGAETVAHVGAREPQHTKNAKGEQHDHRHHAPDGLVVG